jgi:hypothetical protein
VWDGVVVIARFCLRGEDIVGVLLYDGEACCMNFGGGGGGGGIGSYSWSDVR